jgi:hypothetical protein
VERLKHEVGDGLAAAARAGSRADDNRVLSPSEEYARRLALREAQAAALARRQESIGNARLLVAALAIVAAWWSLQRHAFPAGWLCIPALAFALLVIWHRLVRRQRSQAERAVTFYRQGLGRIEDRWQGEGEPGDRFDDPHHVYAADLDLFGRGSLFQLLCRARTRMGEEKLAQWLLAPAMTGQIRERQAALTDLRARLDLREELALLGAEAATGVHPRLLLSWAETPNELDRAWLLPAALALPVLAIATAIFWALVEVRWPFYLVLLLEAGFLYALRSSIKKILQESERAFEDLGLFAALLRRLEREQFGAPLLRALLGKLAGHSVPASRAVDHLATIVSLAGSLRNQFVAILAVPLMYPLLVALVAERWRRLHGATVRTWVHVVGELEALISLAAYSYEHPADPFPELHDGPASFEGWQLGHPLLPAARCVRNDVDLARPVRLLLVSGSNMSGKSTLLRTVGINTVLAMAGAPVRAARLRLSALQVGGSIRINDSLHEGSSRFYAEITRLRALLAFAGGKAPLLFLLDELLQGTNSKDRLVGATGILRAFVGRGAIGLVSTHDLALTHIEGLPDGALRNVHFQDELRGGQMTFDFRLRDGVVTKSNGIELMRSVGLDV